MPAGAASTALKMCHRDWQRHLGSCQLCSQSHMQAAGGICSSCPLLASASHPCKGAFPILMLPCSPAIAQPAFFTITKKGPSHTTAVLTHYTLVLALIISMGQAQPVTMSLEVPQPRWHTNYLKLLLCTMVNYYQTYK